MPAPTVVELPAEYERRELKDFLLTMKPAHRDLVAAMCASIEKMIVK